MVEVMIILFFCLRACDGDCSCGVPLQVWEAIAGLSVLHFYNVRQLNCTALLLQATTSTDDPPKTGRVGTGDPPVDLEAWRRMFWICGSCPLQRYGSSGDGGYLLCDLQNATMAAAYSFGIDGRDEWGQEVASCTGATLFQFDCFNTTGAECRSQNMCPPTNFRAECLSAPGCFFDKPSGSLQEHFWRNHVARLQRSVLVIVLQRVESAVTEFFDLVW